MCFLCRPRSSRSGGFYHHFLETASVCLLHLLYGRSGFILCACWKKNPQRSHLNLFVGNILINRRFRSRATAKINAYKMKWVELSLVCTHHFSVLYFSKSSETHFTLQFFKCKRFCGIIAI